MTDTAAARPGGGIAPRHEEMTMNRWVRRVSVPLASTVAAGGVLLGAGGVASAADSQPVAHTHAAPTAAPAVAVRTAAIRTDGQRVGYHDNQYGDGRYGNSRYGNGRFANIGYGQGGSGERWTGHRQYVWDGSRWDEVTPWRGAAVDHWYLGEVAWYLNHR
jgi:hypothetical protein